MAAGALPRPEEVAPPRAAIATDPRRNRRRRQRPHERRRPASLSSAIGNFGMLVPGTPFVVENSVAIRQPAGPPR